MRLATTCNRCPLRKTRRKVVWGIGPVPAKIMFVAEAPGNREDELGVPFFYKAKAARELDKLLKDNHLSRSVVYITNTVKCHVPKDANPTPEQIATCTRSWLEEEIKLVQPQIVATLGAISTRYFLGSNIPMEYIHGIPVKMPDRDFDILPIYHPAAGLHQPNLMKNCQDDFKKIRRVLAGSGIEVRNGLYADEYPNYEYAVIKSAKGILLPPTKDTIIAIDTELAMDAPYSLQFSMQPGTGYMVMADNHKLLADINEFVNYPQVTTLLHNAIFDIPVLEQMGVRVPIERTLDTMVMAYLLGNYPKGLKALAFRIAGMNMDTYDRVVREATTDNAILYLSRILDMEDEYKRTKGQSGYMWPIPMKTRNPETGRLSGSQGIAQKVKRALTDYNKNETAVNLYDRWYNMSGREIVEARFGKLRRGELCDIPIKRAVRYACMDADATLRIFPHLKTEIAKLQLENVLKMDMAIIPMVIDMHKAGLKPDMSKVEVLSKRLAEYLDQYHTELLEHTGQDINIGSHADIRELLYKTYKLKNVIMTRTDLPSTSAKAMSVLRALKDDITKEAVNPEANKAIDIIKKWREVQKLKTTYADTIQRFVGSDGRIHANIKIINTPTGRLSCSDPNFMAVPNRTELGREIRKCYVPEPGNVLLSGDYSQIELRGLAVIADEPAMLDAFTRDQDIHTMTAMEVFGLPESKIDKYKHRLPCKRVNFGIPYGVQAKGLREILLADGADSEQWDEEACEELINNWLDKFNNVRKYIRAAHRQARIKGYVRDMWGRIRWIPQAHMINKAIHNEGLREAQNMPIQSFAAGVIKQAMAALVPLYRYLSEHDGIFIKPLIQIHDDLVWEVSAKDVWQVAPLIKDVMEDAVSLPVPTPVDMEVGVKSWGEKVSLEEYLRDR